MALDNDTLQHLFLSIITKKVKSRLGKRLIKEEEDDEEEDRNARKKEERVNYRL